MDCLEVDCSSTLPAAHVLRHSPCLFCLPSSRFFLIWEASESSTPESPPTTTTTTTTATATTTTTTPFSGSWLHDLQHMNSQSLARFLVALPSVPLIQMGFPKIAVPFLGGPFKGILLYLGQKRGTPSLGNIQITLEHCLLEANRVRPWCV